MFESLLFLTNNNNKIVTFAQFHSWLFSVFNTSHPPQNHMQIINEICVPVAVGELTELLLHVTKPGLDVVGLFGIGSRISGMPVLLMMMAGLCGIDDGADDDEAVEYDDDDDKDAADGVGGAVVDAIVHADTVLSLLSAKCVRSVADTFTISAVGFGLGFGAFVVVCVIIGRVA